MTTAPSLRTCRHFSERGRPEGVQEISNRESATLKESRMRTRPLLLCYDALPRLQARCAEDRNEE